VGYLHYALIILALVALYLYVVRIPGERRLARRPTDLADRARSHRRREQQKLAQQKGSAAKPAPSPYDRIIKRELKNVPTPWGWPGSDVRSGGLRNPQNGNNRLLPAWFGRQVSEKRAVDDSEYRLREAASLRALLEDRFGRAAKPEEVEFRKVKPPLLRDPGRPYDQEDNFPSGRTDQIVATLKRQPGTPALRGPVASKVVGLKEVRTPWGW
jgi:hypothetical protein